MTLPARTVRTYTYVPNLLSSLRIVLAPAILGAAYANSRVGFTALLSVALVTDLFDGVIARHWKAETPLGRRLDRWGDGLTMSLGAIGISFLWPDIVERESGWMLVALAGYAMIGLHRLLLPSSSASRPGWFGKLLAMLVPVSLIPLLGGWDAVAFHVAAAIHAAVGLQKLVATERASAQPAAVESSTPLLPEVQG